MERQKHGFEFEKFCATEYGIHLNPVYIDKWDGELNGIPVSIKCIKEGAAIDLADIFRQASITEDFYMIVGFHNGAGEVHTIYKMFIPSNEYHKYFLEDFEDEYRNFLKNITNDYSDDDKWKAGIKHYKEEWANGTPNIIRPNFKRDHKKQKRVQCSIPNKVFFKDFLPKYEIEEF